MLPTEWQAYDHYVYALIAVGGTAIAVAGVYGLMTTEPWARRIHALKGVAPPFINVVGVLFGLTLAFLANDTWTAHDRALNAILREADSLRSLSVLSDTLDPRDQIEFRAAIATYAKAAVAEWPLLARCQTDPQVDRDADHLLLLAARASSTGAVQQSVIGHVANIRASRDLRIELSQTHVNPLKWLGMAFLGFLTLLSVAVVHADNVRAAMTGVILFALAAAPTTAIVLIHGNPFQEPQAVSPAPIANALP